jgi:hypothetical protein
MFIPLLILLLAATTPVGTGDGVHRADLLHPLLPHLHLIDGRVVSSEVAVERDRASLPSAARSGPAIGSGAGAELMDAGSGLGPTLPLAGLAVLPTERSRRLADSLAMPTGRVEAPPDPPPTSAA